MSLSHLPMELLLLIEKDLKQSDISSLVRTNKWTYHCLNNSLYDHNVQRRGGDGLIWASAHGWQTLAERFLNLGADPGIQAVYIGHVARFPPEIYPKDCDFDWRNHLVIVSGSSGTAKAVVPYSSLHGRLKSLGVHVITPLEAAMACRRGYMAQFLLEYDYHDGAIPRTTRERAERIARSNNMLRGIKFNSERDERLSRRSEKIHELFKGAIISGDVNLVQSFLDKYQIDVNWPYPMTDFFDEVFHVSALYYAVQYGHTELVRLLLSRGAWDVRAQSSGASLLYTAIENGHLSTAELLLQQPAVFRETKRLINRARKSQHSEKILELLRVSVLRGNLRIVKPSDSMKSAMGENISIATLKILLAHPGIKTTYGTSYDSSALHEAVRSCEKHVVELLLAHDAVNVNYRGRDGDTALMTSIRKRKKDIFKLLLDHHGIDLEVKNNKGLTALAVASSCCDLFFIEKILASGRVDVNSQDNEGDTPLFHAARVRGCKREVVDILLEQPGITRYPKNNKGITPAQAALGAGNKNLGRFLKGDQKLPREIEALLKDEFISR